MKLSLPCAIVFALLCTTGCSASSHDFDSVVSGVEQRYSVHPQHIPLMGLVSFCGRIYTHGGVKGMRIAEFDHVGSIDSDSLYSLVRSQLGAQWQPMVTERSTAHSEMSVVFVQPSEKSMRMLFADYENGELDLVRMELNGSALAKWMRNPQANVGAAPRSDSRSGDSHPGRTD